MKTTKFVLLGLPIYLVLASSFRVLFNKELLSDQYYKFLIAFGCLVVWLIILFIEKRKSKQQPK